MWSKGISFRQIGKCLLFLLLVTQPSQAGVLDCARAVGRMLHQDVYTLAASYLYMPHKAKKRFARSIQDASDEDIEKVERWYEKFRKPYALSLAVFANAAYGSTLYGVNFWGDGQVSSSLLAFAAMTYIYANAAWAFPAERRRYLALITLISAMVHFYLEMGPLPTGNETFPPQTPRSGTDYADLYAGLATTAFFPVFIEVLESLTLRRMSRSK